MDRSHLNAFNWTLKLLINGPAFVIYSSPSWVTQNSARLLLGLPSLSTSTSASMCVTQHSPHSFLFLLSLCTLSSAFMWSCSGLRRKVRRGAASLCIFIGLGSTFSLSAAGQGSFIGYPLSAMGGRSFTRSWNELDSWILDD